MKIKDMAGGKLYRTAFLVRKIENSGNEEWPSCTVTLSDADQVQIQAIYRVAYNEQMEGLVGKPVEVIIQKGVIEGKDAYLVNKLKPAPENIHAEDFLPQGKAGAVTGSGNGNGEDKPAQDTKAQEPGKGKYIPFSAMETGKSYRSVFRLRSAREKVAQNGSTYCVLALSDCNLEQCQANLFSTSEKEIRPFIGNLVEVSLTKESYKGNDSYLVGKGSLGAAPDDAQISDFAESAPLDAETMFQEVMDLLGDSERPAVLIAKNALWKYKEKFLVWPGAQMMHHSYISGLLYHTLTVMRMADRACQVYPSLDRGLLLAGAAVHDIGKLEELSATPTGDAEFSLDGSLQGHIYLGCQILFKVALYLEMNSRRETAEGQQPVAYTKEEDYKLLVHMVLSHHGIAEWGSMKTPMTQEALVLHFLDNLDSKMDVYQKAVAGIGPGELTSQKIYQVGTQVYHPVGYGAVLPQDKPEDTVAANTGMDESNAGELAGEAAGPGKQEVVA